MFIYPRIFRLPIKQLVFPIFPFLTSGIVQYFGQIQRTSQVERKQNVLKKQRREKEKRFLPAYLIYIYS